jgi:hypothetical protein
MSVNAAEPATALCIETSAVLRAVLETGLSPEVEARLSRARVPPVSEAPRALLPVATLYVGKLIIDEVVLLAQLPDAPDTLGEWMASGLLDRLGMLLGIELGSRS